MHTEIPKDAPAFEPARSDYPLGGEKTGPIWRAAWRILRDAGKRYVSSDDALAQVQYAIPGANRETVRNILYAAVRAGVLETDKRPHGRYANMTHFRIKVSGR